jgi:hypothetical protein
MADFRLLEDGVDLRHTESGDSRILEDGAIVGQSSLSGAGTVTTASLTEATYVSTALSGAGTLTTASLTEATYVSTALSGAGTVTTAVGNRLLLGSFSPFTAEGIRFTESGDTRVTESGDTRYTNDITVNIGVGSAFASATKMAFSSTVYYNDEGTWKEVSGFFVNNQGTWEEPVKVNKKLSGVWKRVL